MSVKILQPPPPLPPQSSADFGLHLAIAARKGNGLPYVPDFVVALDSSDSSDLMWHIGYNHIKRSMRLRGKNVSFTDSVYKSETDIQKLVAVLAIAYVIILRCY